MSTLEQRQELCVFGYIRENCKHCAFPDELQRLCAMMYVVIKDEWMRDRVNATIEIENNRYKVRVNYNKDIDGNGYRWKNAFGKLEISQGQSNEWRFRIHQKNKQLVAIFIGILPSDAIDTDFDGMFFAGGKIDDGYGYYGWNGTKYGGKNNKDKYGTPIKGDDIIFNDIGYDTRTSQKWCIIIQNK